MIPFQAKPNRSIGGDYSYTNILVRQHDFPSFVADGDAYSEIDSDRVPHKSWRKACETIERHKDGTSPSVKYWLENCSSEQFMAFCQAIADTPEWGLEGIKIDGARVTVTANRSSGHPVYQIEVWKRGKDTPALNKRRMPIPGMTKRMSAYGTMSEVHPDFLTDEEKQGKNV
jgi:hypothetical protein